MSRELCPAAGRGNDAPDLSLDIQALQAQHLGAALWMPVDPCIPPSLEQLDFPYTAWPTPISSQDNSALSSPCDPLAAHVTREAESKKEKRKVQNRSAQRAFRMRRQQRTLDLEAEVENLSANITSLKVENGALKSSLRDARTEIMVLEAVLPCVANVAITEETLAPRVEKDGQSPASCPMQMSLADILARLAAEDGDKVPWHDY